MRQKNGKKGFAMLEVMIIIMIFMVLAASLFASAGAMNRRAVNRATNNEAYYAALAAVKLMAGEVMNDEQGQAAVALTGGSFEQETSISITTEDGETRSVPVTVSSKTVTANGSRYLKLTAKARVGSQTENVSLTLQERNSFVPDYPYGCGVMGKLSLKSGSTFYGGPDVDLYLQGLNEVAEGDIGGIVGVGGNLIVDGKVTERGLKIQLKNVGIGGMIISNDDVSLENCVVGNSRNKKAERKGGIYTLGDLTLTNCDIYGDTYSNEFMANGKEYVLGSVNYIEWNRNNFTVWNSKGEPKNTAEDEYRRNGEINAGEGLRKILFGTNLKDYVPKSEDVFVPQTDGITDESAMKVIRLKRGEYADLNVLLSSGSHGMDQPIEYVIVMEEGSVLYVFPGTWNVYVYGSGTVDITRISDNGDVTIYGGIQAERIDVTSNIKLEVYHGEPADEAFKTPSSAVGFKHWVPLDYNMDPALED